MNIPKLLDEFKGHWLVKAKSYIQTPGRLGALIPQVKDYMLKGGLKEVKDKLVLLVDYLIDIANGRYKNYDSKSLLYIVAAMIYLVSPIDFIPDFIFGIGLTDDVAIILFVLKETSVELDKYKKWRVGRI